ncbi:hypothetical protein FRX31_013112, partial [Thalictrum thalictroides]
QSARAALLQLAWKSCLVERRGGKKNKPSSLLSISIGSYVCKGRNVKKVGIPEWFGVC